MVLIHYSKLDEVGCKSHVYLRMKWGHMEWYHRIWSSAGWPLSKSLWFPSSHDLCHQCNVGKMVITSNQEAFPMVFLGNITNLVFPPIYMPGNFRWVVALGGALFEDPALALGHAFCSLCYISHHLNVLFFFSNWSLSISDTRSEIWYWAPILNRSSKIEADSAYSLFYSRTFVPKIPLFIKKKQLFAWMAS